MSFPRIALLALLAFVGVSSSGCDKDEPKPTGATASATVVTPPPPSPATTGTTPKPQLAVDDTAAFVAGERIDLSTDAKGRIAGALTGKPVEGETLVLNASRDAKLPKVAAVFAALLSKKAKAVEVHTPLRDRSAADVVFVLDAKAEGCSTVGYIAKDSAIATWPASGATAERFTHGMAGPDLTRGSEGIRKRVLACDAPVWFAAADDNVTWGLVFDMVIAVMRPDDAGLPKARSVALLTKTPVPGRKIEND
jgi:hypothetical protein